MLLSRGFLWAPCTAACQGLSFQLPGGWFQLPFGTGWFFFLIPPPGAWIFPWVQTVQWCMPFQVSLRMSPSTYATFGLWASLLPAPLQVTFLSCRMQLVSSFLQSLLSRVSSELLLASSLLVLLARPLASQWLLPSLHPHLLGPRPWRIWLPWTLSFSWRRKCSLLASALHLPILQQTSYLLSRFFLAGGVFSSLGYPSESRDMSSLILSGSSCSSLSLILSTRFCSLW